MQDRRRARFGSSQAKVACELMAAGSGTRVTWRLDSELGYNPVNRLVGSIAAQRMVDRTMKAFGESWER